MTIKAVVFDFDGLIIDTETVWYDVFKEVMESYGHPLPLEIFAKVIGTTEEVLYNYFQEQLKEKYNKDEIKAKAEQLQKVKMASLMAREGVKEYLEEAKALGLKIGLASSSRREWIESFLTKLHLRDYFETIKSKEDVQLVKPNPELYLQAVEALSVRPEEAIAFEDSLNGSIAALNAGLHVVVVPNSVTSQLQFKNYSYRLKSMAHKSLSELIYEVEAKKTVH